MKDKKQLAKKNLKAQLKAIERKVSMMHANIARLWNEYEGIKQELDKLYEEDNE